MLTWTSDLPDPISVFQGDKALMHTGWFDSAYQELLERAEGSHDQAERLALYAEADRQIVQSGAVIPFRYYRSHFLLNPAMKRYPLSAVKWWFFKDVIIEE
jgi:ABC-type oligopeptide transport system substrate-binding subunit